MLDPKTGLPPRFLRTPDAARFLGISIRTLEKHRTYGTGKHSATDAFLNISIVVQL